MKKPDRCGNCGSTNMEFEQNSEFSVPWRDYPTVVLNNPPMLWQCSDCKEAPLSVSHSEMVDQLIEKTIKSDLDLFFEKILKKENCNDGDIATRIGISVNKLREIKMGYVIPEFQTYNFLKVLALSDKAFEAATPTQ